MTDTPIPTPAGPWGSAPPPGLPDLPPLPARASAADDRSGVAFTEKGRDFLRLIVRGAWLQFLTFGFYRFWLNTDIRRHFWSHTLVDGDGAEYTGTARELLIGFLFALAILVPVYLLYFLAGLAAERIKAFASVPLGLFLVLFGQFAIYRARRYRLTRTVWRGVRFWMTGSGWNYALRSFGWLLLVALTLGLLHPWRAAAMERYKMRHTYYGNIQGGFDARAWDFFKRGIWLWLLALLPFVFLIASLAQIGSIRNASATHVVGVVSTAMVGFLIWPILWPFYQAIEWRWWASGVRIGEARLASSVRGGQLFALYAKLLLAVTLFALAVSLLFGLLLGFAELLAHGFFDMSVNIALRDFAASYPYTAIAAALVVYLFVGLAFGVVQRYYLLFRYWDIVCDSLAVRNIHALDGARVEGALAGSLGEGLADGLDVGGF